MKDKTYEHEGVKLVKKPFLNLTFRCEHCFFKEKDCNTFVNKIASCFKYEDGNNEVMIFVEANEPVNKID